MSDTISKLLAAIQEAANAVLATTKTHKWWWAGGGGVTLAAIIAVVVVFGGFFGPSGKAICAIALDRARSYGVVPSGASLVNFDAKKDDQVKDRRQCTAEAGEDKFVMSVDLTCKDLKKADCLSLYAVERADGLSTYQKRKEEPDETEAALPAPTDQGAAPAAGQMPDSGQPTAPAQDSGQNASGFGDLQPATGNNGASNTQQPPQQ